MENSQCERQREKLLRDTVIDPTCVEACILGDSGHGRRGHGDGRRLFTWRDFVGRRLRRHGQPVRVVALQRVVVARVFRRARLALAAATTATTTQAATEVATGQDAAQHEQRFAPRTGHHEVRVYVLLAELLRYVQTE